MVVYKFNCRLCENLQKVGYAMYCIPRMQGTSEFYWDGNHAGTTEDPDILCCTDYHQISEQLFMEGYLNERETI